MECCHWSLDSKVMVREDGSLSLLVYRRVKHTDQYLLFNSHHPLRHRLGVIKTLQYRADTIVTSEEDKEEEREHIETALKRFGYPKWAFTLAHSRKKREETKPRAQSNSKQKKISVTIPYVANTSEKIRRILNQFDINTTFKPGNTLRQMLVHPKDKVKKENRSGVVYGISCSDPSCEDVYIGETAQPLHKRMYQHRRPSASGLDSAVYTHLQEHDHTFKNEEVKILDSELRWFERGVREAVREWVERPSVNRRGGLRFNLARTWDWAL